jgi:hypothetical protein
MTSRSEAMKAFIQAGQALEHDNECLRSEGKFDAECTCKKDKPMSWQGELTKKRCSNPYGAYDAPDRWKDIILEADEMLAYIDPNYRILQIKEKFGGLRYYFESEYQYPSIQHKIMDAIIYRAEGEILRVRFEEQ